MDSSPISYVVDGIVDNFEGKFFVDYTLEYGSQHYRFALIQDDGTLVRFATHISVWENKMAAIQTVNCGCDDEGCVTEASLVKFAMVYVLNLHKNIESFSIDDNMFHTKKITNDKIADKFDIVLWTPRRILQGKKGWSEEWLNSKPYGSSTRNILAMCRDTGLVNLSIKLAEKHTDWSPAGCISLAKKMQIPFENSLIWTSWEIPVSIVKTYKVKIGKKRIPTNRETTRAVKLLDKAIDMSTDDVLQAKYRT